MADKLHRLQILKEHLKELTHQIEVEFKHYEDDTVVEMHKKKRLHILDEMVAIQRELGIDDDITP